MKKIDKILVFFGLILIISSTGMSVVGYENSYDYSQGGSYDTMTWNTSEDFKEGEFHGVATHDNSSFIALDFPVFESFEVDNNNLEELDNWSVDSSCSSYHFERSGYPSTLYAHSGEYRADLVSGNSDCDTTATFTYNDSKVDKLFISTFSSSRDGEDGDYTVEYGSDEYDSGFGTIHGGVSGTFVDTSPDGEVSFEVETNDVSDEYMAFDHIVGNNDSFNKGYALYNVSSEDNLYLKLIDFNYTGDLSFRSPVNVSFLTNRSGEWESYNNIENVPVSKYFKINISIENYDGRYSDEDMLYTSIIEEMNLKYTPTPYITNVDLPREVEQGDEMEYNISFVHKDGAGAYEHDVTFTNTFGEREKKQHCDNTTCSSGDLCWSFCTADTSSNNDGENWTEGTIDMEIDSSMFLLEPQTDNDDGDGYNSHQYDLKKFDLVNDTYKRNKFEYQLDDLEFNVPCELDKWTTQKRANWSCYISRNFDGATLFEANLDYASDITTNLNSTSYDKEVRGDYEGVTNNTDPFWFNFSTPYIKWDREKVDTDLEVLQSGEIFYDVVGLYDTNIMLEIPEEANGFKIYPTSESVVEKQLDKNEDNNLLALYEFYDEQDFTLKPNITIENEDFDESYDINVDNEQKKIKKINISESFIHPFIETGNDAFTWDGKVQFDIYLPHDFNELVFVFEPYYTDRARTVYESQSLRTEYIKFDNENKGYSTQDMEVEPDQENYNDIYYKQTFSFSDEETNLSEGHHTIEINMEDTDWGEPGEVKGTIEDDYEEAEISLLNMRGFGGYGKSDMLVINDNFDSGSDGILHFDEIDLIDKDKLTDLEYYGSWRQTVTPYTSTEGTECNVDFNSYLSDDNQLEDSELFGEEYAEWDDSGGEDCDSQSENALFVENIFDYRYDYDNFLATTVDVVDTTMNTYSDLATIQLAEGADIHISSKNRTFEEDTYNLVDIKVENLNKEMKLDNASLDISYPSSFEGEEYKNIGDIGIGENKTTTINFTAFEQNNGGSTIEVTLKDDNGEFVKETGFFNVVRPRDYSLEVETPESIQAGTQFSITGFVENTGDRNLSYPEMLVDWNGSMGYSEGRTSYEAGCEKTGERNFDIEFPIYLGVFDYNGLTDSENDLEYSFENSFLKLGPLSNMAPMESTWSVYATEQDNLLDRGILAENDVNSPTINMRSSYNLLDINEFNTFKLYALNNTVPLCEHYTGRGFVPSMELVYNYREDRANSFEPLGDTWTTTVNEVIEPGEVSEGYSFSAIAPPESGEYMISLLVKDELDTGQIKELRVPITVNPKKDVVNFDDVVRKEYFERLSEDKTKVDTRLNRYSLLNLTSLSNSDDYVKNNSLAIDSEAKNINLENDGDQINYLENNSNLVFETYVSANQQEIYNATWDVKGVNTTEDFDNVSFQDNKYSFEKTYTTYNTYFENSSTIIDSIDTDKLDSYSVNSNVDVWINDERVFDYEQKSEELVLNMPAEYFDTGENNLRVEYTEEQGDAGDTTCRGLPYSNMISHYLYVVEDNVDERITDESMYDVVWTDTDGDGYDDQVCYDVPSSIEDNIEIRGETGVFVDKSIDRMIDDEYTVVGEEVDNTWLVEYYNEDNKSYDFEDRLYIPDEAANVRVDGKEKELNYDEDGAYIPVNVDVNSSDTIEKIITFSNTPLDQDISTERPSKYRIGEKADILKKLRVRNRFNYKVSDGYTEIDLDYGENVVVETNNGSNDRGTVEDVLSIELGDFDKKQNKDLNISYEIPVGEVVENKSIKSNENYNATYYRVSSTANRPLDPVYLEDDEIHCSQVVNATEFGNGEKYDINCTEDLGTAINLGRLDVSEEKEILITYRDYERVTDVSIFKTLLYSLIAFVFVASIILFIYQFKYRGEGNV